MEFTPIILSGGEGAKLYPLAEHVPKPLLPIANRPLIWYVLALLEKAGFQKVYIIVQQSIFDKINSFLNPTLHNMKIEIELVSLPPGNYKMGTADALRFIAPRIKTDFLILPCDVLTDVCLQSLADIHRLVKYSPKCLRQVIILKSLFKNFNFFQFHYFEICPNGS